MELIRAEEIPAFFTEVSGSHATARALSRETGVTSAPLTMIMSGEGSGLDPYLKAMESNLETILEALA